MSWNKRNNHNNMHGATIKNKPKKYEKYQRQLSGSIKCVDRTIW
jgi:hypothetical protein